MGSNIGGIFHCSPVSIAAQHVLHRVQKKPAIGFVGRFGLVVAVGAVAASALGGAGGCWGHLDTFPASKARS